jgi:hypothetical protein
MKRGKDVLWIATLFNRCWPRRDTKNQKASSQTIRKPLADPASLLGFRMGGDKSMQLGLKAFSRVAWLSLMVLPVSAIAQGAPEERRACTRDVLRLCSAFIPDSDQITACLREKNAELSDACRQIILAGMKPPDSSGTGGAGGRIAR